MEDDPGTLCDDIKQEGISQSVEIQTKVKLSMG